MGLAFTPGLGPERAAAPDDPKTEDERRSNLLRHAAIVLWGTPVLGVADPIRVEHASTPLPHRIGLGDVQQVATTTARLRQLSGDLGGIPMAEALTAHARASEALLGAAMREQVRERLLLALADAHSAAGVAAADAGLRDLARQHFTRGMDCAGAGGDMIRAVASLRQEGRTELHFGQPNEALKLFQLGAATAPIPLARAMLESDCAWALGLLGLAGEAHAALRRAHDSYAAAGNEPDLLEGFSTALPHVEGCTYLALGRFDRATMALARAVDGAGHAIGCTTLNLGYLATAQLQRGELRSGLHTAERAIGLAKGLRSVSVRDGLASLQDAAEARRDSACRDLAHELATLRSAA